MLFDCRIKQNAIAITNGSKLKQHLLRKTSQTIPRQKVQALDSNQFWLILTEIFTLNK
jgi:hypothetical protein